MKAVVIREFGPPDVMRLEEIPTPVPGPDEVLIQVHAVSVNRTLDLAVRAGTYSVPAALPHILGGLKIAGGLSLVGAVVAEIAAGAAGAGSGLAYRISESGYRLNIPRMFAALLLLSVAGIVIFFVLSLVSHLLLRRWHESAVVREI